MGKQIVYTFVGVCMAAEEQGELLLVVGPSDVHVFFPSLRLTKLNKSFPPLSPVWREKQLLFISLAVCYMFYSGRAEG